MLMWPVPRPPTPTHPAAQTTLQKTQASENARCSTTCAGCCPADEWSDAAVLLSTTLVSGRTCTHTSCGGQLLPAGKLTAWLGNRFPRRAVERQQPLNSTSRAQFATHVSPPSHKGHTTGSTRAMPHNTRAVETKQTQRTAALVRRGWMK